MKYARPLGFERRRVQQLLRATKDQSSTGARIAFFSRCFLGHPYKSNPLIGSADRAEVFTASLDGFDCVTYIETILALARASDVDDFVHQLRKIRYERGRVQWERRNHYLTFWLRNNIRNRVLRRISPPGVRLISRDRVLSVVSGLASRRAHLECVPKGVVPRLEPYIQNGDLICFVSTRRNLDFFHAGLLARNGKGVVIRHASRSRGSVVEQPLNTFLKRNRMTGIIVARPRQAVRR